MESALRRPDGWSYALAALSFLPGVGPIFAALSVHRVRRRRYRAGVVIAASILGSLVTLVPIASYLLVRVTGYDEGVLNARASESLVELGEVLERAKEREGRYPETLDQALGVARLSSLAFDPIAPRARPGQRGAPYQYFFYRPLDGRVRYELFSMGRDGLPHTADDILPSSTEKLPGLVLPVRDPGDAGAR